MNSLFLFSNNIPKNKLPNVVQSVLAIVENNDPESLGVMAFYLLLLEQQHQLEAYTEPRVSHPLTKVIKADRKKALDLINSIRFMAKSVEKANLPANAEMAALVLPLINMHLMKVGQSFTSAVEKKTKSFLVAISEKETIHLAASTLGFGDSTNELKLIFNKLTKNVDTRRVDFAARRMIKGSKLEKSIIKVLTNLLKAIELAKVQHPAVDYSVVISELNELFISYRTLYRSKKTRNANASIKKETVALSSTTTATAN